MNESKCTHYDPDYTGLCIECGHDLDYTTQSTTDTQYQPEVGGWCEIQETSPDGNWRECFYVGIDSEGEHIFQYRNGDMYSESMDSIFRPIKTEREQFIEHSLAITATEAITLEEAFTRQYDDGARFK